jgi:hypothetical protein
MIHLQFVYKGYAFKDGTKRFLKNIPWQQCHKSCENILKIGFSAGQKESRKSCVSSHMRHGLLGTKL